MISVSGLKFCPGFGDGLRVPPRRTLPSLPLWATANGVTSRATATTPAKSHGPLPSPSTRLATRLSMLGGPSWGAFGSVGPSPAPNSRAPPRVAVRRDGGAGSAPPHGLGRPSRYFSATVPESRGPLVP